MLTTINGIMINVDEIQTARTVTENDIDHTAGTKVWFIHDGWTVIPDITVEQLQGLLDEFRRTSAPF